MASRCYSVSLQSARESYRSDFVFFMPSFNYLIIFAEKGIRYIFRVLMLLF
jgi:hypothetical protein